MGYVSVIRRVRSDRPRHWCNRQRHGKKSNKTQKKTRERGCTHHIFNGQKEGNNLSPTQSYAHAHTPALHRPPLLGVVTNRSRLNHPQRYGNHRRCNGSVSASPTHLQTSFGLWQVALDDVPTNSDMPILLVRFKKPGCVLIVEKCDQSDSNLQPRMGTDRRTDGRDEFRTDGRASGKNVGQKDRQSNRRVLAHPYMDKKTDQQTSVLATRFSSVRRPIFSLPSAHLRRGVTVSCCFSLAKEFRFARERRKTLLIHTVRPEPTKRRG